MDDDGSYDSSNEKTEEARTTNPCQSSEQIKRYVERSIRFYG